MQPPVSLKSVERKVFQTTFADGLWDVLIGSFVLVFALAPILSLTLGDFWSSFIFLPFWGLVYLAIWLTRKFVVAPRLGRFTYSEQRQRRLRKFSLVMVGANLLIFLLGVIAFMTVGNISGMIWLILAGLFMVLSFSIAAFLLDYPRLYIYGLLLGLAPLAGEWLYTQFGAAHHGFPLVFGFVSFLIIFTGLATFTRMLIRNPRIENRSEGL